MNTVQRNISLLAILLLFSSVHVNAQSIMLKPIKKINCQGTKNIFVDSTENYWLSTSYGGDFLWKQDTQQQQFNLPLFIRGQLKLIDNNTKISGGYFEYDIESGKYIEPGNDFELNPISNILDGINPDLSQNRLLYEVENSLFDMKANRLVLALQHRESRRGDPELEIEIPSNVFGLVNLETKELIRVLDQSNSSYEQFILTDQHIIGWSVQDYADSITVWELESGNKLFTLPFMQKDISAISPIPNQEGFIITSRNGDVIQYDILEREQNVLKSAGALTQKVYALGVDSLYFFFDENSKGILYRMQNEKLEMVNEIELNGTVMDFYFNEKTSHIWIATNSEKDSIIIYELTK